MAATFTENNETRLYFYFERDGETTDRYLSLPGIPDSEGDRYSTVIQNFYAFRTYVLANMNQFLQPSTWRDETGSSTTAGEGEDPWTTTDVHLEFYTVSKTHYDGTDE